MFEGIRNDTLKSFSIGVLSLMLTPMVFIGCKGITEVDEATSFQRDAVRFSGTGEALIYEFNPTVLSGTTSYDNVKYDNILSAGFITNDNYLNTKCIFDQSVSSSASVAQTSLNSCYLVLNDVNTTQPIQKQNDSWNFDTYSDEFYQVNTYYHLDKIMNRFYDSLSFAHKQVHFNGNLIIPPATKANLYQTYSYWLTTGGTTTPLKAYSKCDLSSLNAFFNPSENTLCFGHNSSSEKFFMVQDPTIIYHEVGHALVKVMLNQRNVTKVVNPFNMHNGFFAAHPFTSDLGSLFYDEGGSINEGIADYFSYYINDRKQVGEWALGKVLGNHRPLEESNSAHSAEISTVSGERLSYPQFLYYDPNNPDKNIEDVHYAGQIVTHYLVALTEAIKSSEINDASNCSITSTTTSGIHKAATDYVFLLLNETLAEVGDLTAKGSDLLDEYGTGSGAFTNRYFTNLNSQESFLWTHAVNPPSFRRFFQILAKNSLHHITNNLCSAFTKDESEKLLDDFGLLLFRSYEDRGNGYDLDGNFQIFYDTFTGSRYFDFTSSLLSPLGSFAAGNTQVNEANRRNTVLVSKDFVGLSDTNSVYVFDGQTDIAGILANLSFEGENITTTQGIAGVEYNNNNIKISPGEVVGLSLDIFNNANTAMSGVQILANDWDHLKLNTPNDPLYSDGNTANDPPKNYVNRAVNSSALAQSTPPITGYTAVHSPCIIDNFPLASEGGVTDTDATVAGNCANLSKNNYDLDKTQVIATKVYPKHEADSPQPICLVQYSDENETKWVSQDFYRQYGMSQLEDGHCLNNPSMSGDDFNPNECLIRFLPGAQQAILGKIDPQSTWAKTLKGDSNESIEFTSSNIVLMEVNKNLNPGTRFNCRMRVRFSNCADCFDEYSDAFTKWNDHPDFENTGSRPFKVINFQFQIEQ